MRKEKRRDYYAAAWVLLAFLAWTAAVRIVDVQAIGPQGSVVGLATVNGWFHRLTGVHLFLYHLTDWLSLIPLAFAAGFAVLGLIQWIRRKGLLQVDREILTLGGYYLAVVLIYMLFEVVIINHRPVLIEGILEPSYPSSTTMLILCVMPATVTEISARIGNPRLGRTVATTMTAYSLFMVTARLLSGVHWLTDIIGGALLSAGLVCMYAWARSMGRKP
jgi:undecaprenyl-diphosphatase